MTAHPLPGCGRAGREVVDGVALANSTTSDRREVNVKIDPDGWRPVLGTPRGNAPMRVQWLRFSLAIPGGELGYGVEFGGELTDQADIDRRDRNKSSRSQSSRFLRRTVKAADLEERAAWVLPIVERFRPPYVEVDR